MIRQNIGNGHRDLQARFPLRNYPTPNSHCMSHGGVTGQNRNWHPPLLTKSLGMRGFRSLGDLLNQYGHPNTVVILKP